ncbi:MAG: PPK2 family polyphosphate kinase [Bacteroidota bacterium]
MSKYLNGSTTSPSSYDKDKTKAKTADLILELRDLQAVLYAEAKRSVLIVLQGIDASGKDGTVKNVFTGVNPMGCQVHSFKDPTELDMSHDFLWRVHQFAPAKGMMEIFNRSHYEDILVPTVHKLLPKEDIKKRYDYINSFEQLLTDSGTIIFKFFLHISKEEQAERFQERKTNPEKEWKYQPEDMNESKFWDDYMKVYEDIFEHCSPAIPWTIVPADQNWYRNYFIAKTLVEKLKSLNMKYPEPIK